MRGRGALLRTAVVSTLLSVLLAVAVNVATGGTLPAPLAPLAPYAWLVVAVAAAVTAVVAIRDARADDRPAPPAPPAQLRSDGGYTGRTDDLARLRRMVDEGHPVVVVTGPPGVGKSALAAHAAHALRARYPDGQLFAPLGGGSGLLADPATVLTDLLDALDAAVSGPTDADRLAARYRSTLAGRRVLVLLDDARDAAQVRPLLPGAPGCLVLITSRSPLADLAGAAGLELAVLGDGDALALLRSAGAADRVTAEPAAAREVVAACGALPLALQVAGGRLRARPTWSLADLAARLRDERARLDELTVGDRDLRAVFAESLRRIDPGAALLLRRLALLPAPAAGGRLAAALLDVPVPDAERALDRLAAASLVSIWDNGDEVRYRVHDLVRICARELTDDADVAALRRGYEALLGQASAADRSLGSRPYPVYGGGDPALPVGWFEVDGALVLAAAQDAVGRGWPDLAWRLVCATTNVALSNAYGLEWMAVAGEVLAAGPGDDGAAAIQLGLGMVRQRSGVPMAARGALRAARRAYVAKGDRLRAATAATYLSMAHRMTGRWRAALAAADWAIARLDGDPPP
ncbi:NB-ARC domain-containing protein, partial [Asanoa sp. NPDC050611]|uniref:NB-ARC domain-containing protein n=1 Tax=Asanoa sp. NPDC050611 TaxID=3157098 RepID=UPI0033D8C524